MGEHEKNYPVDQASTVPRRPKYGMKAGCVLCSEIRVIYQDGELEVIHAESTK